MRIIRVSSNKLTLSLTLLLLISLTIYVIGSDLSLDVWGRIKLPIPRTGNPATSPQPPGGGGGGGRDLEGEITKVLGILPDQSQYMDGVQDDSLWSSLAQGEDGPVHRGCQKLPSILSKDNGYANVPPGNGIIGTFKGSNIAEWTSADPSDKPAIEQGVVVDQPDNPGIAVNDVPVNHQSHDFSINVKPDYGYLLNNRGNELMFSPNPNGPGSTGPSGGQVMEMEWESKFFNDAGFWPSEGDRVWVMGRFIYDCAHIFGALAYKTELHPVQAMAVSRFEPVIFPGHTGPSDAVKTYIFIRGQGGYYNTKVGGRDYVFDIVLPPKDEATSTLKTQVLNNFGTASPILTPMLTDTPPRIHVVYPLSSYPASENNLFKAIILAGWERHPDGAGAKQVGPTSVTGVHGSTQKAQIPEYRELQVTLDSFTVTQCTSNRGEGPAGYNCGYYDPDLFTFTPGCDPTIDHLDNRMIIASVNGHYMPISGFGVDSPLRKVCFGQTVDLNVKFPPVIVKVNPVNNPVPDNPLNFNTQFYDAGGSLKIRTTGYEQEPIDSEFGSSPSSDTSGIGTYQDFSRWQATTNHSFCLPRGTHNLADNFGVGSGQVLEQSTTNCSTPSTNDGVLKYHVTELKRFTTDSFVPAKLKILNTGLPSKSQSSSNPLIAAPLAKNQSNVENNPTIPSRNKTLNNATGSNQSNASPNTVPPLSTPTTTAPIAINQSNVNTNQTMPVDITLQATDRDPNAKLQAQIVSQPQHGKLGNIDQATGKVTYTPDPHYAGGDMFTFKVNDGKADSNIATVTIIVISKINFVNRPLLFNSTNENSTLGNLTTPNPISNNTLNNATGSNQSNASPNTVPPLSTPTTTAPIAINQSNVNTNQTMPGNTTSLSNNTLSELGNNTLSGNSTDELIAKALAGIDIS